MRKDELVRVRIAEGEVRGHRDQETFAFKGLPYAAPPTGERRWRAPQPPACWQGVRDADQFAAASWQNREHCLATGGGDPGPLAEDCLYLNIWTPDLAPQAPLPVMVWIHGGGYNVGSGGLQPYRGAALARRGAVIVTLNYRLGHLGFFAHPALAAEQSDAPLCNFALLDQIAALQWVQRNIAEFGGDRHNVTLFGESSGARSVLSLYASPLSAGLFHKGIVQSAYGLPDVSRERALQRGCAVARALGLPPEATADDLRRLPAEAFWPLEGELKVPPVAISGDAVLPEPMLEIFDQGRQRACPLLIGSNSDEASVLAFFGVPLAGRVQQLRRQHPTVMRLMRWLYAGTGDDALLGRQLARDIVFTALAYRLADDHARSGRPVWRYYFDYVAENARDLYPHGTWHGNEIGYVFATLDDVAVTDPARAFTAVDRQFAQRTGEYWLQFARGASGAGHALPGRAGDPAWPVWSRRDDRTLCFGEQGQATIALRPRWMRWRLWLFRHLMRRVVHL
ncbi:carboxylesterase/lipase family protein [Pantoea sp. 1.19]|uniref:carboxylesterase/lipase family protein n=1 Tax=Pantoea sp. 1.19 TaxID=1925589 RepID=UPI000948C1F3|nr:carboxylesterase/lipase family protein [Pantoea sp. 1.19]